jgi:hypothetical protein
MRIPRHPFEDAFSTSSRALTLSGVGEKGGARLLGRAAVRPFYNIINGLKNRLRAIEQKAISCRKIIPQRSVGLASSHMRLPSSAHGV